MKPTVLVVAAILWRGDEMLIGQRPAHKTQGGLWEFVGGKVEAGETLADALARECLEEIGVQIAIDGTFAQVRHEYPEKIVELTLFEAHITQGEPRRLEHQALRWVKVHELDADLFCPADRDILARIKQQAGK